MRFSTALSTATLCLATAEGLKFKMFTGYDPMDTVRDLSKRASTISTTFKYAAPQFSYYVDILVGSAHSFIRLRLSSDPFTWFPGPLPSKNYCNGATDENFSQCIQSNFSGTFDPKTSTTFKNLTDTLNLTSSNAAYYVLGYYGQDTLQIGQTEIDKVPIGIATEYTRTPQLGLGIGGSGSTQKTLLQTMIDQDVISVLAYGLYLNDFDTNSSELTIGAIDTAKYDGNLITFESSGTTTVQLNTLQYDTGTGGSPETLARSWNANIEFSTGLNYFPNGPLETITSDVDAYYDSTYGGYLTDCSYRFSNKSMIFNFEGMTITVPASQWIVPAITVSGYQTTLSDGDTPACIVLVDSMDNYSLAAQAGYVAVFGMPFVRATYLVHDFTNQQTSFAQAKLNVTGSELKSLGADGVAAYATMVPSSTSNPSRVPTGAQTSAATSNSSSENNSSGGGKSTPTGAIVGGVVGGIAVIAAAIGVFIFLRRRGKKQTSTEVPPPQPPMNEAHPQQPYGGYTDNPQAYNQGYGYNQGYNEQYGQVPNMPNKGFAPPNSPPPQGYVPPHSPMSEMAGNPVDPRHQSIAGVSELPSPKEQNMPVELPGHQ